MTALSVADDAKAGGKQPKPHRRGVHKAVQNVERSRAYKQLWRVVDGAVFDALYSHDDYLTPKGRRHARLSINKRVVGAVLGFAEQSAKGRSGESSAAERVGGRLDSPLPDGATRAVPKWRAVALAVRRLFTWGSA